nr:probable phospholipid-transporting ATPase 4 [Tanacetum cinerariifolium]
MGNTDEPPVVKADPKDWFKKLERPPTPDPKWNEGKIVDNKQTHKWLSDLAKAEKPPKTFNDLMSTLIDFSAFVMNHLQISDLTQDILVGPAFNLLKGTYRSYIELEYNMEECYKALTDQLDWNNPEGDRYPFNLSKPLPLVKSRNRQIISVDYFFNNDLAYLQGGSTDRTYTTSLTKTKAAKYDLPGIEDMTLQPQRRGHNAPGRCITTFQSVRDTLHDMATNLRIGYNKAMPKRRWSHLDKTRSHIMVILMVAAAGSRQVKIHSRMLILDRQMERHYESSRAIVNALGTLALGELLELGIGIHGAHVTNIKLPTTALDIDMEVAHANCRDCAYLERTTIKIQQTYSCCTTTKKYMRIYLKSIEKELMLLGAIAIDDKLQDGVAECIEKLPQAGIKIWLLTGDKRETAVNIGFACSLLRHMQQFHISLSRDAESKNQLEDVNIMHSACINIFYLQFELKIALLVKRYTAKMTLAIGDGATDVGMIQEADIGIGISGMEGMQQEWRNNASTLQISMSFGFQMVENIDDIIGVSIPKERRARFSIDEPMRHELEDMLVAQQSGTVSWALTCESETRVGGFEEINIH